MVQMFRVHHCFQAIGRASALLLLLERGVGRGLANSTVAQPRKGRENSKRN